MDVTASAPPRRAFGSCAAGGLTPSGARGGPTVIDETRAVSTANTARHIHDEEGDPCPSRQLRRSLDPIPPPDRCLDFDARRPIAHRRATCRPMNGRDRVTWRYARPAGQASESTRGTDSTAAFTVLLRVLTWQLSFASTNGRRGACGRTRGTARTEGGAVAHRGLPRANVRRLAAHRRCSRCRCSRLFSD